MSRSTDSWLSSEQALVGAVLIDPAAYWKVADRIEDTDLAGDGHAIIWRAVTELLRTGKPVDAVTLSGQLRSVGLAGMVITLANDAPGSANIAAYADLVAQHAEHRRTVAAGQRITKLAPHETDQAPAIVAAAQRAKGSAARHIGAVLTDWRSELERRYNAGSAITGLSTGIEGVDALTAGLQRSNLFVLAARPSMGKSALAGQWALHSAQIGEPAAIFSLEMTDTQFANRMIAAMASVSMNALRSPQLIEPEAWPRIKAAAERLRDLPLFVDQTPAISVEQLSARARQLHGQHHLRLIVVDYLQLMRMRNPDKLTVSIAEITGALKRLAKELDVTVLLLSQLNRDCDGRTTDKRPVMSDLRDSGSIEQDANDVAFLYRDEVYRSDSPHKGYAELIFRKQRDGCIGTVPLRTELQFQRFLHCDALPAEEILPATNDSKFANQFGRKARPGGYRQ